MYFSSFVYFHSAKLSRLVPLFVGHARMRSIIVVLSLMLSTKLLIWLLCLCYLASLA
ncbi:hypothetical protein JHK82_048878 [Glycine max]|uniref:Uncharacterized protein n=1 Tax=Glycine max TaxID=3847 RepID=K7MP07_SOYBN|nr:hypothetical protein JHK86_048730 [Glycine max]KAG4944731.1 hypothetical protein JHK85_049377 [Glycine max]KAG5099024.1 hypothetical protein JHK82_048878 [Glycine max]KAH1120147.1 hypothetical protein GYH30_048480 [Glycine max]KRH05921.1 hypothetical protein GLYMA_17G256300v4 [Glycine max]